MKFASENERAALELRSMLATSPKELALEFQASDEMELRSPVLNRLTLV